MKRLLPLVVLMSVLTMSTFAQNLLTGVVVDEDSNEPLIGATVLIQGSSVGTTTDFDGSFKLMNLPATAEVAEISYIGYETLEVTLTGQEDLGTIALSASAVGLKQVEVVASVAVDRKTPVAVSTINREFIAENASNQEYPELLKSTPGVYATKTGGGYGDSRINLRGFNSQNVAVMINGVPVNDMENGRVYWSNWAGLTDVTRSMQVQRGLGASKVAVPSIGGTINILTSTIDMDKGGSAFYGIGNDNYRKTAFSLSSGLTENDWAFSVLGAKIEGDGWAEGLNFVGYNYFFNVSKVINKKHTLSLTGFGAPQRHGQRQNRQSIQDFRDAPQGLKYNADYGYLNGQLVNVEDNFYHKPQFSLNHFWTINETSDLSTAIYVSTGTGGGGGTATDGSVGFNEFRTGDRFSPYDLDAIVAKNLTSPDGHAYAYLRASRNDHKWYGALSTYTKEVNSNFDILAGLDFRSYKGIHFSEVVDLLGADYALDDNDVNNPNRRLKVGDKRDYYNDGIVLWEGAFVQGEYSDGALSAFISLSASNTSYKRIDYYNYLDSDPLQETDFQNFFGYQMKGGVNYNLNRNHNLFANIGFFEKAPDFDAVFQNFRNDINAKAENQKIMSFELGYGYRSSMFRGNINLYRTTWNDRTFTKNFNAEDDPNTSIDESLEELFANILGVNAVHQGIEVDFSYQPTDRFTMNGMLSVGDWTWAENVEGINIFDERQNQVGTIPTLYIQGLKVGDAAQTTAALGIDFNVIEDLKLGMSYNYYANLYSDFDPVDKVSNENGIVQSWKVPDYGLFDVKAIFDFKLGTLDATLYANVNNLFNEEYISDSIDGDSNGDGIGDAAGASVFFGLGRTWTTGLKVRF